MRLSKRAWLYITRKKLRTLLMFCIFFVMATAFISGISIKKATQAAMQQARISVGGNFSLNINYNDDNPNIKRIEKKNEFGTGITMQNEGDPLSEKIVKEVAKVPGIRAYNASANVSLRDHGLKAVEAQEPGQGVMFGGSDSLPNFQLQVNLYSSQSDLFQNGTMKLVEGKHIQPDDKQSVLIHKKLAEKNNLKIGDTIPLLLPEDTIKEMEASEKEVNVKIVGIYDDVKQSNQENALPIMMPENTIISDMETGKMLLNRKTFDFDSAKFFVNDPKDMMRIVKNVKQLDFDWKQFVIDTNDMQYQQIAGSIERIDQLITTILYAVFIISCIILTLILTLWIKGRLYESGVLLSLGISKSKIIGQYIVELLMVACIAFALSYLSGRVVSQSIGDSLMESVLAQKEGAENGMSTTTVYTGSVSLDAFQQEEIKSLDVSVNAREVCYVYMIGTALIIITILLSSISILRMNPKEILSNMS